MTLRLVIGNKNYSSWSMRPWVLMRQAGIEFEEVRVRFDGFDADSAFKQRLAALTPAGKVPVLIDGDLVVWDTLAIAETLAERFPDKHLWPVDAAQRARARSLCAELHAGFGAIREHLAMNIEAALPEVGRRVLREVPALRAEVDRVLGMWGELLEAHRGPMLFGEFGIVDAYYAPIVTRFRTYGVPVPAPVADYMDRVMRLEGVAEWIRGALEENDFRPFEEPYRSAPRAPFEAP